MLELKQTAHLSTLHQGSFDTGAIQQVIPSISNNIMLCDDAYWIYLDVTIYTCAVVPFTVALATANSSTVHLHMLRMFWPALHWGRFESQTTLCRNECHLISTIGTDVISAILWRFGASMYAAA